LISFLSTLSYFRSARRCIVSKYFNFEGANLIDSGNTLLILRKWAVESTLLLFRYESTEVACGIDGTISEDPDSTWQVRSRREDATFTFSLDGCASEYVERRAVNGDDVSNDVAEKGAHFLPTPFLIDWTSRKERKFDGFRITLFRSSGQ
jgi:hypothetical protein